MLFKKTPPKCNAQSIARKLISRSIKCLGKSAAGNTTTIPFTDTSPSIDSIPEKSAQPYYFPRPPYSPSFTCQ